MNNEKGMNFRNFLERQQRRCGDFFKNRRLDLVLPSRPGVPLQLGTGRIRGEHLKTIVEENEIEVKMKRKPELLSPE